MTASSDHPADDACLWRMRRSFSRRIDSVPAMFDFIREALAADDVDPGERNAIEFTVEELFTNMVKYNAGSCSHIELELEGHATMLVGRICDPDSECFDVTTAPDADLELPAGQRQPGGLGLHLLRRLVDSIEYDYTDRRSVVTFARHRRRQQGRV